MKISVDLDGVVCNFSEQIVAVANSIWPDRLPQGYESPQYGYKDNFSKEDWGEVWRVIRKSPAFYEHGPAYEDNIASLRNFLANQSGHEIYFVTSRRDTGGVSVAIQTQRWLTEHGIYGTYASSNYKAIIPVSSPDIKKFVMADLDIHFSIDDMGTTVEQCSVVQGHRAFLLDRPWNRDKDYGIRLSNLDEYFDIVLGKDKGVC